MNEWTPQWYRDPESGEIPALTFLEHIPDGARTHLLAIRDAVMSVGGPARWRDTTSHALMRGDLDFMYEARDRHGDELFRLFLIWDRDRREVIQLDGRSKPVGTALPSSEYDELAALGRRVLETEPRPYATTDHIVRRSLERASPEA